jgi:IS30 family transposase
VSSQHLLLGVLDVVWSVSVVEASFLVVDPCWRAADLGWCGCRRVAVYWHPLVCSGWRHALVVVGSGCAGSHLSLADREAILADLSAGQSYAAIGRWIGRSTSTVIGELEVNRLDARRPSAVPVGRRGGTRGPLPTELNYSPVVAQRRFEQRLRRHRPSKLADNPALHAEVVARLNSKHSPEQISSRLRTDFPDNPEMWVSHETIYRSLYVQGKGELKRELTRCLRTGRAVRKPQRRDGQRQPRIRDMVNISQRPAEVADRALPGHWEDDLILGKNGRSAIGTLVERSAGFTTLLHLPTDHTAVTVRDAMITAMSQIPQLLRKTLTWDQGPEMAEHLKIADALDLDIYFCDPASPWQRGSNENTNGLLRQYFPKGTDLSGYHPDYLAFVAAELNARPRKTLGWKTPAEAFGELLSNPPIVATTA